MPRRTLSLRLAALTLLPVTLAGCEATEEEAAARQAGESWLLVEQGQKVAEEEEKPAAPPVAEQEDELPELEPAEEAEALDPRCTGAHRPGRITVAAVTPAATTATVTWYHPGDPTVTTYKVTAISQSLVIGAQPEIGWTDAEPGEGCAEVTATVTGLEAGTPYVFSVDAVRQPTWQNGVRTATVARSGVVSTT
ncbi:hypothetical protein AMIS_30090 [Actinoplanes missouriensis 431]|uniref:Fibronectin type-III domain-containing protein n=1 Tax=Actinoplanes missouriensis (strain ATCC 14538 / DSM 43046 / CBS 188.64 / JCM 3121 / NBRC 102363 / NCIMB 12654 / NRRL B-3342 / UNCC 431) TaxID=512565 RepID=I0H5E2_ACTM4|nr:fibronectin type III domain-containing protein [Actinoplanes missouriensis]BAL88229.1 hypothetical protein AMIS_30090 [Actinoplanes missouriensis 431]